MPSTAPILSGSQVVVSAGAAGTQDSPHVSTLADGRIVHVWRDLGASSSTIRYQVLDIDGTATGISGFVNDTQLSAGTVGIGGGGDYLAVAGLDNGGFAVAWMYRDGTSLTDKSDNIYFKIYDGTGAVTTATTLAHASSADATGALNNQTYPDIFDNDGDFFIGWTDPDPDTTATGGGVSTSTAVVEQGYLYDGGIGGYIPSQLSDAHGGDGHTAGAADPTSDEFLFVWQDDLGDPPTTGDGIYAYEGGGAGAGFFRIDRETPATNNSFARNPDAAYDHAGNALVVYMDRPGSADEIWATLNGNAASRFKVNTTAPGFNGDASPAVVGLSELSALNGGFMVFWTDQGSDGVGGTDFDVVGQLYSVTAGVAEAVGGEIVLTDAATTNNNLSTLDATLMLDGRILVSWEAGGPTTSGTEIYQRIVDPRQQAVSWAGTSANEQFQGTIFDDDLSGGLGNDRLDGGLGDDSLAGNGGNDTYIVDSAGDTVTELAGEGTDIVRSTVTFTLGPDVEHLTLLGSTGIGGTGNGGANTLTGNAVGNVLRGGGGNDTILGGLGNDTLFGDAGNDVLTGGANKDTMTGGAGLDDFDFNTVAEIGRGGTRDRIMDFRHNQDDIDLRTIDANGAAAGNTAFKFLAAKGAAFTGVKGQIHWFHQAGKTIIEGDIDGNRVADFQIELVGLKTLTAGDFLL
ncbi:MAG: calcium-binding protein [Hyphomicrobiaceae bacterium]|nr:calcium-binding protein [Hyphomicrobiaceae bacterium]